MDDSMYQWMIRWTNGWVNVLMDESMSQWTNGEYIPISFASAIRFVATSLMVLCEAPDDRMVAARQALNED